MFSRKLAHRRAARAQERTATVHDAAAALYAHLGRHDAAARNAELARQALERAALERALA